MLPFSFARLPGRPSAGGWNPPALFIKPAKRASQWAAWASSQCRPSFAWACHCGMESPGSVYQARRVGFPMGGVGFQPMPFVCPAGPPPGDGIPRLCLSSPRSGLPNGRRRLPADALRLPGRVAVGWNPPALFVEPAKRASQWAASASSQCRPSFAWACHCGMESPGSVYQARRVGFPMGGVGFQPMPFVCPAGPPPGDGIPRLCLSSPRSGLPNGRRRLPADALRLPGRVAVGWNPPALFVEPAKRASQWAASASSQCRPSFAWACHCGMESPGSVYQARRAGFPMGGVGFQPMPPFVCLGVPLWDGIPRRRLSSPRSGLDNRRRRLPANAALRLPGRATVGWNPPAPFVEPAKRASQWAASASSQCPSFARPAFRRGMESPGAVCQAREAGFPMGGVGFQPMPFVCPAALRRGMESPGAVCRAREAGFPPGDVGFQPMPPFVCSAGPPPEDGIPRRRLSSPRSGLPTRRRRLPADAALRLLGRPSAGGWNPPALFVEPAERASQWAASASSRCRPSFARPPSAVGWNPPALFIKPAELASQWAAWASSQCRPSFARPSSAVGWNPPALFIKPAERASQWAASASSRCRPGKDAAGRNERCRQGGIGHKGPSDLLTHSSK